MGKVKVAVDKKRKEVNIPLKEFTLSHGVTKNMGNYESFRADLSMTVEVNEGDNIAELIEETSKALKDNVEQEYKRYITKD